MGQTSHGGNWLATVAQRSCGWRPQSLFCLFLEIQDSWHPPRAAPHSNKPRSSCHNIFPLEGAGVSVIATWYFLAAVLITSPRPSPAKKEGSWEGPKQRGLGPLTAPPKGKGNAVCLVPPSSPIPLPREAGK